MFIVDYKSVSVEVLAVYAATNRQQTTTQDRYPGVDVRYPMRGHIKKCPSTTGFARIAEVSGRAFCTELRALSVQSHAT